MAHDKIYDRTLYVMAGLLACGLVCNLLIRPVDPKYTMSDEELAVERVLQREDRVDSSSTTAARGPLSVAGVLAWIAVGLPFLIGLVIALQKAAALL